MSTQEITYAVENKIAWITINRPDRMNALTANHMTEDMPALWARFNKDDSADVAVVTGAGERAFCSGIDVRQLNDEQSSGKRNEKASQSYLLSPRANEVWKPVIAAVNGVCAGIAM